MTDTELEEILLDAGVVRNRLKIYSVRKNAIVALEIQEEFGSLDNYFWGSGFCHVDNRRHPAPKTEQDFSQVRNDGHSGTQTFPIINHGLTLGSFPTESDISKTISKDLKKRGMSFVGSTIIYAFMQAVGMVDDHIDNCHFKKTHS